MRKTKIINVNKTLVSIIDKEGKDYISLTDMVKDNGGNDKIQNWIRNKDTIEFLGIWEQFNNPDFNSVQLHRIMYEAGVRRFIISISQWIEQTNAIGIISKTGKFLLKPCWKSLRMFQIKTRALSWILLMMFLLK